MLNFAQQALEESVAWSRDQVHLRAVGWYDRKFCFKSECPQCGTTELQVCFCVGACHGPEAKFETTFIVFHRHNLLVLLALFDNCLHMLLVPNTKFALALLCHAD